MTLEELLKAQNLTDQQVAAIINGMKENKIFTASEENLDIRYGKLKTNHDALVAKDAESQKLIAELQKATKGQEEVQNKITEYEATIAQQQEELEQTKLEAALKVGLLSAGAKTSDIDYLLFKMGHDDEWKAELDEAGQIKGLEDKLKGLKTQFPNQFVTETEGGDGYQRLDDGKLPGGDNRKTTVSKERFNAMGYEERVKLKEKNAELYKKLARSR